MIESDWEQYTLEPNATAFSLELEQNPDLMLLQQWQLFVAIKCKVIQSTQKQVWSWMNQKEQWRPQSVNELVYISTCVLCNTGKGHQSDDKVFTRADVFRALWLRLMLLFCSFLAAVIHKFDYVFAENGTVQYKDGKLISKQV